MKKHLLLLIIFYFIINFTNCQNSLIEDEKENKTTVPLPATEIESYTGTAVSDSFDRLGLNIYSEILSVIELSVIKNSIPSGKALTQIDLSADGPAGGNIIAGGTYSYTLSNPAVFSGALTSEFDEYTYQIDLTDDILIELNIDEIPVNFTVKVYSDQLSYVALTSIGVLNSKINNGISSGYSINLTTQIKIVTDEYSNAAYTIITSGLINGHAFYLKNFY